MKPALALLVAQARRGSRDETSTVPVERTGPTSGVFRGPVRLYRVLDRFERDLLADDYAADPRTRFSGGRYSVPVERAGGAAFAASREEALRFGRIHGTDRGRLRPPLYLVEVEGEGLPFTRIDLHQVVDSAGRLPFSACAVGLGCNARPRVADVIAAWEVVDPAAGTIVPIDWLALLRASATGTSWRTLQAIEVFEHGYEELHRYVSVARNLSAKERAQDGAHWTRLLRETHAAMVHLRMTLPGYDGLGTFEYNVVHRLPLTFQREWKKLEAAQKPARARKQVAS